VPETDLYMPVKSFLEHQGYAVKSEIGSCDVMAVRGDEPPVIVELKPAFNLKLLLQGVDRQAITDAVYLAIAAPKRGLVDRDVLKLLRRLGLGLLIVHHGHVEPHLDPEPYQPRKNAKRKALLLKEFHRRIGDHNTGGMSKRPVMTAYRQDALRCLKHLDRNGPSRIRDVAAATQVPRAATILRSDVYGWFVKIDRGIYHTSPKAADAMKMFGGVLAAL
jgi:hypothetical protein